ncbi:MAG: MiaB/RimO family radical SAM methylthiotransferase [Dehalococcoidales bacterium]
MPNYYIWTIGCQMNKAESERLGGYFEKLGYQLVAQPEAADLVIINSCVVRQSAEDRVLNKLDAIRVLKASRLGLAVVVTGCLVDGDTDSLKRQFPFVDYFFAAGGWPEWLKDGSPPQIHNPAVTAYLPIIQGCNNFCSYCIVPYRRGPEKSRPPAEIVAEAAGLAAKGVREVTLLGQNVDSYGADLPSRPDLARLLAELNKIEGLYRIRFLTNHPKDMSDSLIEAIAGLAKVCEQINIPLQAGDDRILEAMRRGYTAGQYRRLVARIRQAVPEISLSTDVIVGFPGETEGQFEETLKLLAEIGFATVHVAAYSPRPGTLAAAEYEDDVPAVEKKKRLKAVEKLQKGISTDINARLTGSRVEVLVEGRKKGKWHGRSRSGKLVFFSASGDMRGRLKEIVVNRAGPWSLQGEPTTI